MLQPCVCHLSIKLPTPCQPLGCPPLPLTNIPLSLCLPPVHLPATRALSFPPCLSFPALSPSYPISAASTPSCPSPGQQASLHLVHNILNSAEGVERLERRLVGPLINHRNRRGILVLGGGAPAPGQPRLLQLLRLLRQLLRLLQLQLVPQRPVASHLLLLPGQRLAAGASLCRTATAAHTCFPPRRGCGGGGGSCPEGAAPARHGGGAGCGAGKCGGCGEAAQEDGAATYGAGEVARP